MGDVNGVGPEILAKALGHPEIHNVCVPLVVGDIHALESAQEFTPYRPLLRRIDNVSRAELDDTRDDSSPGQTREDGKAHDSTPDKDESIRSTQESMSSDSVRRLVTFSGYTPKGTYKGNDYSERLAENLNIPLVSLSKQKIPDEVLRLIDPAVAQVYRVIPVAENAGRLVVATEDPTNTSLLDNLERLLDRPVDVQVATPKEINSALEMYYDLRDTTVAALERLLAIPGFERFAGIPAIERFSTVPVYEAGISAPPHHPGQLDPEAGRAAVEWTKAAVRLAMDGVVDGIVTCPINKEGIHKAGYHYNGHTELIAEMTGAPDYTMSLFAGNMRIVHITTHLSMRDAIDQVKKDRILTTIRVAHDALCRLDLPRRHIAVAGLNPHAGEAGAFGREEIDEIEPAIRAAQAEGIDCSGPYPADSIFRRMRDGEFDLVVAMYHDQGHVPLKLIAMDEGVNVTLGIPIVRTSVDHGTAYDIAGKGVAREESLLAALRLAAEFARRRPNTTK